MTFSILRLEAPMMSFGAPIVSEEGLIQPFPALSMMTGLLANALGYDRREAEKHESLQAAISYAVREDVPGRKIVDYQTVWLGKKGDRRRPNHDGHLYAKNKGGNVAWTTWGRLDRRGSGETDGTIIRNREYWADAQYTVALHVEGLPVTDVEDALVRPERPLFIGRKPCLPATRIFWKTADASLPQEALRMSETIPTGIQPRRLWHESDDADARPVTDARDWTNQIHVGERRVHEVSY